MKMSVHTASKTPVHSVGINLLCLKVIIMASSVHNVVITGRGEAVAPTTRTSCFCFAAAFLSLAACFLAASSFALDVTNKNAELSRKRFCTNTRGRYMAGGG